MLPLPELEPAPDGERLPGLELPPLPASPPEPGRAVPLVLAPLLPLGAEESPDAPAPVEEEPLVLLPLAPLLPLPLVAAIAGADRAQVRAANANAQLNFLFMGRASSSINEIQAQASLPGVVWM